MEKKRDTLEVEDPVLPRKGKRPARFGDGSQGFHHKETEEKYRQIYFERIDLSICSIEGRFKVVHGEIKPSLCKFFIFYFFAFSSTKIFPLSRGAIRF